MAEINIKKKSTPAWAWILGLIVLIAGRILIYNMVKDDSTMDTRDRETVQNQPNTTTY